MPYLTPDEIPEDDDCRPLSIPASTEWLAIVSGALTELTRTWNWEQQGSVTVEDAVARMKTMVAAYYSDPCSDCTQPGGDPWVGIGELGEWRMLDEEGTYVEPFGDYALPALTARTEPTEDERKCLAAKNAVNVLAELYEQVTDAAESGIQAAEFLVDFALLIGLAIAGPLGLLAGAALKIAVFAYKEFFDFADFLTEDFWNAEFTEKMVCIFRAHTIDTAGVVTFDFEAIYTEIWNTQQFDLLAQGIRLAGQVQFLLRTIGSEGLNLAGEATAITDADCEDCPIPFCYDWLEAARMSEWDTFYYPSSFVGGCWEASNQITDGNRGVAIQWDVSPDTEFTEVNVFFSQAAAGTGYCTIWLYLDGLEQRRVDSPAFSSGTDNYSWQDFGGVIADRIMVAVTCSNGFVYTGDACIENVRARGIRPNPFGDDNCD